MLLVGWLRCCGWGAAGQARLPGLRLMWCEVLRGAVGVGETQRVPLVRRLADQQVLAYVGGLDLSGCVRHVPDVALSQSLGGVEVDRALCRREHAEGLLATLARQPVGPAVLPEGAEFGFE